MGKIAEYIRQDAPTFGIEVEFCTHDSEILSFTHIEVCTIKDGAFEWKIETDADYTLELVSPVLTFKNHKLANEFKRALMAKLDEIVRGKPNLITCLQGIGEFLTKSSEHFAYYDFEGQKAVGSSGKFVADFINQEELIEELGYRNWDNDTDLRRVLGWLKKLESMEGEEVGVFLANNVLLRPSEKHGGLPSSQLNLPMSLPAYVWYANHVKEAKAWYRLALSGADGFQDEWKQNKRKTAENYPHLTTIWKKQYLNDDHLEGQIDENVHIWHRYWFWLVNIRELTEKALPGYKDKWDWRNGVRELKAGLLNVAMDHPPASKDAWTSDVWQVVGGFENLWSYYKKDDGWEDITEDIEIDVEGGELYSLLYVTIHKLIAGAMGVLSEGGQLRLQEMIVGMRGEISPETAEACIPNASFLKFHYALKDLTPMWFKGSLADVIASTGKDKKALIEGLQEGLEILLKTNAVETVLTMNMLFLGRLYLFNDYYHTGNDYEWDEFREDLLPDIGGLVRQFEKGAQELRQALGALLEDEELEEKEYPGLEVSYKKHPAKNNTFLNRKGVPPWEGRWDTMKPPMKIDKQVEFLVEHRNN